MHKTELEIIVAVDEVGGFGKSGKIPWHYSEDLKHFKELTTGHICIMGRKTYDDILKMRKERDTNNKKTNPIDSILPNRDSYVITRSDMKTPGATKARNIREVASLIPQEDPRILFVIGGERMFIEAFSWTKTVHLTLVPGHYKCDKFFPINILSKQFKISDGTVDGDLKFLTYKRIK